MISLSNLPPSCVRGDVDSIFVETQAIEAHILELGAIATLSFAKEQLAAGLAAIELTSKLPSPCACTPRVSRSLDSFTIQPAAQDPAQACEATRVQRR